MRRLVLLRPEPGASLSAARARELGLDDVVTMPLFQVESVAWEAPDAGDFDALLLTSANAVRQAGDGLARYRGLPVHAVGAMTAAAARDAGLLVDRVGDGGVEALLDRLPAGQRLLHLAGEARHEPATPRHAITAVTVYRSAPRAPADPMVLAGAVACVHSPRAGERIAEVVETAGIARSGVAIAAISAAAGLACGDGWEEVAIAARPEDSALLALAKRLCDSELRKDGE